MKGTPHVGRPRRTRANGLVAAALAAGLAVHAQPAAAVDFHLVTITLEPAFPAPLGSGLVTSSDRMFECRVVVGHVSGTCTHSYLVVTSAVVDWYWEPTPDSCFVGSGVACDPAGFAYSGEYTADTTVIGLGFKATKARVYVARDGTGSGTVTSSPAGINCGTTCNALFDLGTNVTVTAVPAAASTFLGWDSDGPCAGSGPVCTFGVDGVTVRATFGMATAPPPTAAPTAPPTAAPSHPPSSTPAASGSPATSPLPSGAVTATPAAPARGSSTPDRSLPTSTSGGDGTGSPAAASFGNAIPGAAATDAAGAPLTLVGGQPPSSSPAPDLVPVVLAILGGAAIIALGVATGLRRTSRRDVEVEA